jgi:hypothetical protein
MNRLDVYNRRTFRYVDAYSHLDEWTHLGRVRLTPPRRLDRHDPVDSSQGPVYLQYATIPVGMDKRQAMRAIEDTLSGNACTHEYDCCGCQHTRASAKPFRGRVLKVKTTISFNY